MRRFKSQPPSRPTCVAEYLTEWLDGRRDVRANTLAGYRDHLKPVIEHLGATPLQHLRTADVDALVTLRLGGEPIPERAKRERRAAELLAYLRQRPQGAAYAELHGAFGEPGIKALDRLVAAGDVLRPERGRYVAAQPGDPERPKVAGGVSNRTVVTMLGVLSHAVDDAVARSLVACNVARLVERPKVASRDMTTWTPEQAGRFREHLSDDRLAACWLLTLAGLRRSEVLGLDWADVNFDAGTGSVAQGRVVVAGRSRNGYRRSEAEAVAACAADVADVLAALRALKARQAAERLRLRDGWPDTELVAVNADGTPVRPEAYSKMFRSHREVSGVPVIRLHDALHTAATMLLDGGTTVAVTAKWLGHDPAMTLRVYGHVYDDALASAGDALLGRSRASGGQ